MTCPAWRSSWATLSSRGVCPLVWPLRQLEMLATATSSKSFGGYPCPDERLGHIRPSRQNAGGERREGRSFALRAYCVPAVDPLRAAQRSLHRPDRAALHIPPSTRMPSAAPCLHTDSYKLHEAVTRSLLPKTLFCAPSTPASSPAAAAFSTLHETLRPPPPTATLQRRGPRLHPPGYSYPTLVTS